MKLKTFSLLSILAASAVSALAAPEEDKSRIADFQSNKIPLMVYRPGARGAEMQFEKLEVLDGVVNFVLTHTDGTPGTVYVPINKEGVRFIYRLTPGLRTMRECHTKGLWEDAVKAGRSYVYPALVIMSVSENVTNMHDNLPIFVESLVNAKKYVEAKSLMDALPLSKATPTVGETVINYASKMIDADRYEDAKSVLERLNFGGDNLENIDKVMDIAHKLRKSGKIQEALQWYTKLQSTPDNPYAKEATLWMAYCDIIRGNIMSAQLFTDQLRDLPKTDKVFSLKNLINGMLLMKAQNKEDAIDEYAEGIVYGEISQSWMPELLYNAAMLYKDMKQFEPSNEIFEQIMLLYPSEKYSELAKSEIVVIEKKPEEGAEGEGGEAEADAE
ncbi:MAG: tetratricopeptide repeat protein [Opitutales bacterium]|nr:tetratricopeptide repeat protein [Opitutales bacterium]